jgi:hypothetical protein
MNCELYAEREERFFAASILNKYPWLKYKLTEINGFHKIECVLLSKGGRLSL